jgi:Tfp pilus assembly protein PilX
MAMVVVLSMVVVLGAIVAFAITMSGSESRNTGKLVHNMSLQSLTEATLQYGRNYFATNYGFNGSKWNLFLAYFVDTPLLLDTQANLNATLNHLQAATRSRSRSSPSLSPRSSSTPAPRCTSTRRQAARRA